MALIQTDPTHRKYGVAALVGVLGGFVAAIIKFCVAPTLGKSM